MLPPRMLQAIIDDPAADDIRLIAADWLEDNGQPERGEFIRVQCELAKDISERGLQNLEPNCKCLQCTLRRREGELIREHWCEWVIDLGGNAPLHACGNRDAFPSSSLTWGSERVVQTFRRGFVTHVTCSLAAWVGERCRTCQDMSPHAALACDTCSGSGITGRHGPKLVRAAPLERVVLSDREPQNYHNNPELPDHEGPLFGWWRGADGGTVNLPPPLWDLVAEKCDQVNGSWADFRQEQAALDALSVALLTWARKEPV